MISRFVVWSGQKLSESIILLHVLENETYMAQLSTWSLSIITVSIVEITFVPMA